MSKLQSLVLLLLCTFLTTACAGKRSRLNSFMSSQQKKQTTKSAYNDAELDFWAMVYEPTLEDLQEMRQSWVEYSNSFPESKSFLEVEQEVRKTNQKVVLVSLFSTNYETADLKDKSLGWTTAPTATQITELSEKDEVLRVLMPVSNLWARYFLVRISPGAWSSAENFVVSNKTSHLVFSKQD